MIATCNTPGNYATVVKVALRYAVESVTVFTIWPQHFSSRGAAPNLPADLVGCWRKQGRVQRNLKDLVSCLELFLKCFKEMENKIYKVLNEWKFKT